jgi:hypothetical protein
MTRRLDWRRAVRRRPYESKFGQGVVLRNGAVTPQVPMDTLARRADQAMRAWQRSLNPADRASLAK